MRILRRLAGFAGLMATGLGVGASAVAVPAPRSVTYPMRTMGTYAHVVLVTADSAADAPRAALAQAVMARVDSLMSNWTANSEVARANRLAGHEDVVLNPEVATVVDSSLELWRESRGAFDITVEPLIRAWGFLGGPRRVPSNAEASAAFLRVGGQHVHYDRVHRTVRFDSDSIRIDLGGIAKGYAVEMAARALRNAGIRNALVDLTGNMAALGTPPGADHWRIGIRDPHDRVPYFARLWLRDGESISTSGKYEQFVAQNGRTYGHIMDPRTGRPAEGLISVTVVSRSAFLCDSWDTPLFVVGSAEARRKAKARADFSVILVEPGRDGVDTVWVESALADRFTIEPAMRAHFHVVAF